VLLENPSVTYLKLETDYYTTKSSAEAMTKYLRTIKHLEHIHCYTILLQECEETFYCFLLAFQESTSLKELSICFPVIGGLSNLALETQSLWSICLRLLDGLLEDIAIAAASSGMKNTTNLRELALEGGEHATALSLSYLSQYTRSSSPSKAMFASCLRGYAVDRTELETFVAKRQFQNHGT
jgi:hypothetical protein